MIKWLYQRLMSIRLYMFLSYSYVWIRCDSFDKYLGDNWYFVNIRNHPSVWLGCVLFQPHKDILWKLRGYIVNRGLFLMRKDTEWSDVLKGEFPC